MTQYSVDDYPVRYAAFLELLRQARIDADLTQEDVAHILGKSQSYVSRSEHGERRVDIVELQVFAQIYRKPLSFFLPEELNKEL